MNCGIIGYGYWGPNLARNFFANNKFRLKGISDINLARLQKARDVYPEVLLCEDYRDIIKDPGIEAVAICTPVFRHYDIAKAALEAGKHILIEKPMTSSLKEGEELLEIAAKNKVKIMVDHTFIYTGAVRKIKEIIDSGEIGDIYYFDSVRVNLGLFQHDINVIWDLAPHDISIMNHLLGVNPIGVTALGADHIGNGLENTAYLYVDYGNELIGHIHVNWLAPVKVRTTLIGGSKKMIVFDDTEPSEKVRVYDKGVEIVNGDVDSIYKTLVQYRTGDMYAPKIDNIEALKLEVDTFYDYIRNDVQIEADGEAGLKVVRILEASQKSIKNDGKRIQL
ncbi:Gfo/Idh/MocA family oxidoreductase [bacterium]|nr:Gfo/Idh/MocA family oxidoreductase [bacterium]